MLEGLSAREIGELARRWNELDRAENPSPEDGMEDVLALKKAWSTRLRSAFAGVCSAPFRPFPREERARNMKARDYLWCALNLMLDREEALERLCPHCRAEAEEARCPGVRHAHRRDGGGAQRLL